MEIEKVKEIKKALEQNDDNGIMYDVNDQKRTCKFIDHKDILILINELESENESFKKIDDKLIDVIKHCLHKNDPCYNCENCIKGSEPNVILTCRSILKEIVQLFSKE